MVGFLRNMEIENKQNLYQTDGRQLKAYLLCNQIDKHSFALCIFSFTSHISFAVVIRFTFAFITTNKQQPTYT